MALEEEVRTLLTTTTMPPPLVDSLLDGASGMWLSAAPAHVLAADLALCHPLPAPAETRTLVRRHPSRPEWRVTLLAPDRPGLLATTAGVLAARGMSIRSATATTWTDLGLALQRLSVSDPDGRPLDEADWSRLRSELEAALLADVHLEAESVDDPSDAAPLPVLPAGTEVRVTLDALDAGRTLVSVTAPDVVGLLWALTTWLRQCGLGIEFAKVSSRDGMADDVLVVDGPVDGDALEAHLHGLVGPCAHVVEPTPESPGLFDTVITTATGIAARAAGRVIDVLGALARRVTG